MATRSNRFTKAAVQKADEIGHPVDEETRREADPSTDPERESTEDTQEPKPARGGEGHGLYEGPCEGGPMDGMLGQSRYPKGFLLSDPRDSRAWVYDYDETRSVFVSRKKDVRDTVRELHAAESANYDVRAFDRRQMRGDMG